METPTATVAHHAPPPVVENEGAIVNPLLDVVVANEDTITPTIEQDGEDTTDERSVLPIEFAFPPKFYGHNTPTKRPHNV